MRTLPLQRGDVHDGARPLFQHAGQDGAVQPDCGQQVGAEGLHPVVLREGQHSAWLGERRPDAMHDDIETTENPDRFASHEVCTFG